MGFKFTLLCDLLSSLEENRVVKAATHSRIRDPDVRVVKEWFSRHVKRIRGPDTDQLALLSCMFPEKRTDRVYWLQDTSLARVIGRCLLLGSSRREELERWRTSGGADLGQCVENVMRQAENHIVAGQEVTVEEIDHALNRIASRCRFSGPQVRRQRSAVDVEETLSPLYRRLSSRDAKWLTRMILKTHFSTVLPEKLTLRSFHFLLPHLLLFQNSFDAALNLLSSQTIRDFPPNPEPGLAKDLGVIALQHLTPSIGIKIGRPEYYKARSIKHCCKMIGQQRMSVERKYDGEYCQIHIDLPKSPNCIQIFSKSGKDSTADRSGVHQAIKDSLKIGKYDCKFSHRCILEGELVVWSDRHQKITGFHKLRKFVSRSGIYIGAESDSPPQPYEHLMMVFFDILLLDDDVCLRKPHRERRLLLKNTIKVTPGLAEIAEQRVIDFSRSDGQSKLETLFSKGIAERWEGFVLKGCEDPYFAILTGTEDVCFGRWIKLKKDYIPGLGDTMDVALIGAAYKSRDASSLGIVNNKESWTHFFIGCLDNKEAVLQSKVKPRFRVVDVIGHRSMSERNMQVLNQFGKFSACRADSAHGFDIGYGSSSLPKMDVVFKNPFVVEMLGSGFEKPSGTRYYTLRFPRIVKIHSDRSFEDAASVREMQLLAEAAMSVPTEDLAEEMREWEKRLRPNTSASGYRGDRSQSQSSTASSSSQSSTTVIRAKSTQAGEELSLGSCSMGSLVELRCRQRVHEEPITTPRNVFSIYAERPSSSGSSEKSPEPQGQVLTSNDNLSLQGNGKKRKLLLAAESRDGSTQNGSRKRVHRMAEENDPITTNAIPLSAPLPTEADLAAGEVRPVREVVTRDNSRKTTSSPTESPLLTIPLYIDRKSHSEDDRARLSGFPNSARNIHDFLDMLRSVDRKSHLQRPKSVARLHNIALGVIFIDHQKTNLGKLLLDLTRQVSESFQAPTSTYSRGRIFLINSEFLRLGIDLKDSKLCLRKSWENIGREYFYACVAWDPEVCHADPGWVDEVPGTAVDGDAKGSGYDMVSVLGRNREVAPKIRVLFDREELLLLGEFSSLDPLVQAGQDQIG